MTMCELTEALAYLSDKSNVRNSYMYTIRYIKPSHSKLNFNNM